MHEACTVDMPGCRVWGRRIEGWDFSPAYALEILGGIQLVARLESNTWDTGLPPIADIRWSASEHWKTTVYYNSRGYEMDCTLVEHQTVIVPAGTFDCIRVENRMHADYECGDTFWLAKGVGVVRRKRIRAQTVEEWSLRSYRARHVSVQGLR